MGTVNDALVSHQPPPRAAHEDPHTSTGSPNGAAAAAVESTTPGAETLPPGFDKRAPVVMRYKGHDVKQLLERKLNVDLLLQKGSEWTKLPMSRSEDNYFVIVDLPPGQHQFRFLIEDAIKVDPTQPSTPMEGSEMCNVLVVSQDLMSTNDDDDLVDDAEGWGQTETQFDETRKYPPMLPPHLRYTPLNTPPTQVRCQTDGSLNVAAAALEAEHLPLPLSVTINHVYFQKREDHIVSGMTTRYCNKFTTIAYYQGLAAS